MTPILAGLATALAYTFSTLVSARASRMAGAIPTVAGAMVVGLCLTLPFVLLAPPPGVLSLAVLSWAALSGAANVSGLLLGYAGYRYGAVGVVSTIASTEGAIAAVFSVVAGETLAPGSLPVLGIISLGVALAASGSGGELEEGEPIPRSRSLRAAALAAGAALCFGTGLFATGHVSGALPMAAALLPARAVGALGIALPLVLTRRLSIARAAIPYVVASGCAEVVGLAAFITGAREGIAVTAVLASLFAPLAAISAFILFRERLRGRQIAGIGVVTIGVATLGLLHR